MADFKKIVDKYYPTEEIRNLKLQKNEPLINNFWKSLKGDIENWRNKDNIRLFIFDMLFSNSEAILIAALVPCCCQNFTISEQKRLEVENIIKNKSIFKKIIWEI